MLLQLPTELVEKCVEFAVFPINPNNTKTLLSLLLTCRALYKLTIPCLYDSHILYINRNLYTRSAESRDYRSNLYPHHPPPSFVRPTALHTLLVLPRNQGRSSSPTPEGYNPSFPSNALISIFNQLTALKTLVYTPKPCPWGLVASINALPLTSLTCKFDCNLLGDISIERSSWRLRSLTLSEVDTCPPKLRSFLGTYAATLVELSMSFKKNGLPYTYTAALPKLPKLRCLRLLSYDPSVLRALQGSVDFGRLEILQLVGRRVTSVVSDSLKEGGGLSMLRKLSVQMLPGVLVAVLEMCTVALEELHVVWIDDEESTGMTAAVAEVMARRCKGLKAVSLDLGGSFQRMWGGCEMAMKGEDLEVVARGCTGIEDLYLSVDMHVFASTIDSLPLFSALRHLYLKLHDSPESSEYDSIYHLFPLVSHPYHFDPPLVQDIPEDKIAATAWALDQVVAKQRLDFVSVVVQEDQQEWMKAEWVKPGLELKLAGKDLHLSELRRCMPWFPVAGIGRWNTAFEPVCFGHCRESTGVLIYGNLMEGGA
ncbi:uncharacterized protein H6S33_002357 [Morchella sextelata]|uniref:uncharacterized protein n=1 Tax=Morchella sextelata TaxID=1174677 RepID=UPI001D052F81|nr:uncharacterized protein H6S33_002357 [Morchella sextelata]KAH0608305.1 hypothetical protein H6S33_002357 [Morchella sextelata]